MNKNIDKRSYYTCAFNDDQCKIETKISKIEDSYKYLDCFKKIIEEINDTLCPKDFFDTKDDLIKILKHFLLIFNIHEYSRNNIDYINKKVNSINNNLDNLINLYEKEFDLNSSIVCKIFNTIGSNNDYLENIIPSMNWKNDHNNIIYLLFDGKLRFNTNFSDDMIINNVKKLKNFIINVDKIPELKVNNDINVICTKCIEVDLDKDGVLVANDTTVKKIQESYTKLMKEFPYLRGYIDIDTQVQNQMYFGRGCNFSKPKKPESFDECQRVNIQLSLDELEKKLTNKESLEMIKNLGTAIPNSIKILHLLIKKILNTINKISSYKRIREKMHKIINLFQNVIKITTNANKNENELLQKIVVLVIDVDFLNFGHNYFIDQLKIDRSDPLSIERILVNMASYYYKNAIISTNKYLTISEQEDIVKVNILFYIYMFLIKLSESTTFYVQLKYLNTINLLLIFCCTKRKHIYFPDNNIRDQTIKQLLHFSTFYSIQIITFKEKNNNVIMNNIYGEQTMIHIKKELQDKIELTI